jgi:hypothetical protein
MILSSLPTNCVRILGEIVRRVGSGSAHGPFHRRVPKHHAHHATRATLHTTKVVSWSKIVCAAAGAGLAGAGAAGVGYAAGQGLAQQFPATPPVIVQPFAGVPNGGSVFVGAGLGNLVQPEGVVLRLAPSITPPPVVNIAQEFPQTPNAVDEPASAFLLLTFGLVGGAALAVSKKAAR